MSDEVINKAAAGALATAMAVVVGLTTISAATPSAGPLDASLFKAVQLFAWASALLGGFLLLDGVHAILTRAGKSLSKTGNFLRFLWLAGGTVCWLQGAIAVLAHFHIPGWETVLIQAAFIVATGVAQRELWSVLSRLKSPK